MHPQLLWHITTIIKMPKPHWHWRINRNRQAETSHQGICEIFDINTSTADRRYFWPKRLCLFGLVGWFLLVCFCSSFLCSGAVIDINCFLFECFCLQFLICFLFTCFCFCFVLSRLSAVFDLPVSLCLFGVAGCFPGKIIPSLIPFPPGSAVSTEYLNFYQILNF